MIRSYLTGTPNLEIQLEIKALAQSLAEVNGRGRASCANKRSCPLWQEMSETSETRKRPNQVHVNVTELSGRNRNLGNRGVNMLLNLTSLTV